MKEFIYSLFENKKQKLVWIVYTIFIILSKYSVRERNATYRHCYTSGHNCSNILDNLIVFTLVFIVIALILRNRQRNNDNSKN